MTARSWYVVLGGAVLVAIGLFALRFPVYLDDFDQWGWLIKCGNGFDADFLQASQATNGTGFVEGCETAVLMRRLWTVPVVVVGAVAFFGTLLTSALASVREALPVDSN